MFYLALAILGFLSGVALFMSGIEYRDGDYENATVLFGVAVIFSGVAGYMLW
jgi:hypothetical protein